jgi:quinoprotein glucose dehydrogenase
MPTALRLALFGLLTLACAREPNLPPNSDEAPAIRKASEWPAYGGDPGGRRYAALDDITPENVAEVELAWSYRHGDIGETGDPRVTTSVQATPIPVDGVLFFPPPLNRVIALDPATGAEHLTYDPVLDPSGHYEMLIARGVSAWRDANAEPGAACARRIFTATRDAYLIALDAANGTPCPGFGQDGRVDLNPGAGEQLFRGEYGVTSAPEVVGDRVLVGAFVMDNVRIDAPSGVVRAFDARTGALSWAWDLAPPGYDHATRPTTEAGYALGTPNVWAPMSSDAARDLVFVPTGNPAPDLYRGGDRLDMDYYGSSVVALRASSGEVVWRYQTVHHDLWDFDVPAQPTLVDVVREGRRIPAVVQGTKMGFVFVLHRETGEPLFPVEERPVPTNGAPGEVLSPTQPFPVKPPPLVPLTLSPDDAFGFTFWDRARCREQIEALRIEGEGIYTPTDVSWGLLQPAPTGGVNWGGVAADPERQLLVVNTNRLSALQRLVPRAEHEEHDDDTGTFGNDDTGAQLGTPYAVGRSLLVSPLGAPCNPPPWGELSAIDLASGELRWRRPFGSTWDVGLPFDYEIGLPSFGGPLVTRSGLVFIGAAMGNGFRAFDLETGDELWRTRLPAGAQATPMTYRVEDAPGGPRQFVVVAAGGHWGCHGDAGCDLSDALVAVALPRD